MQDENVNTPEVEETEEPLGGLMSRRSTDGV